MSRSTPHVDRNGLRDQPTAVLLDTPDWYRWLDDDEHRSFHFSSRFGEFTARKERKQRGSWYWVAYRQVNNRLYKTYLGKSGCLSEANLHAAARTLQQQADRQARVDAKVEHRISGAS